jgi:CBS domain-containing protein
MSPATAVLKSHDTVAKALQMLLENKLLALPVVDAGGRYIGMFLRSRLVALLLPRIMSLEEHIPEVGRLMDIGFISDSFEDANERFASVANNSVDQYVDEDTPVLRPDTPVMNAILFLYRSRSYLPVVEESSGKLLGVVSTWDILGRIAGSAH